MNSTTDLQNIQQVWNPVLSRMPPAPYERFKLKKAIVLLNKETQESDRYNEPSQYGTRSQNTAENLSAEHACTPSQVRSQQNLQCEYKIPLEEFIQASENEATNSNRAMPRLNILSHMAKNKTSLVESQEQSLPRRKSSLLCSGKNTQLASQTAPQHNGDRAARRFREGKKFDLLPISKQIAQNQQENKARTVNKLPLIQISSYQPELVQRVNDATCHCGRKNKDQNRIKTRATFFTKKDVFRPSGSREKPTIGQQLFLDNTDEQTKHFSNYKSIKLPLVYRNAFNAPNLYSKYSTSGVSFPVLV